MKTMALVALFVSSLLANPYILPDPGNIGMGALELWPTARSTAMAGAMTGLADEADATYFNPAGLAFQGTARANLDVGELLPGLVPGMYHLSAAGGAPIRVEYLHGHAAYVSGSLVYLTMARGTHSYLWQGYAAAQAAILLANRLGAGIGLKIAHDSYSESWPEREYEKGNAEAIDLALLYRPLQHLSIGAALDNLGPRIVYSPSGDSAGLPRLARLGVCWTPIDNRSIRLSVLPELTPMLVSMPSDTAGFWADAWKAVGIEATAYDLVSIRLGYFEDLANQRGGIVMEGWDGSTYHYGIWDILSRRDLGELKKIGLCWGFGICYKGYIRFDFSSDAAIYDFPTSNWKLSLVANDISELFRRRS